MQARGMWQGEITIRPLGALVLLLLPALAPAASDIPQFSAIDPGPCIRRDEKLRAAWLRARHYIHQRFYADALLLLTNCLESCPQDASSRHLAALCAWGVGQRDVAARWLVIATRLDPNQPAPAAALAALYARDEKDAVAIGWLRRAVTGLEAPLRAWWLTRPSLDPLWQRASPAWLAFLDEIGVPTDQASARAAAREPTVNDGPLADDSLTPRRLSLRPFNYVPDDSKSSIESWSGEWETVSGADFHPDPLLDDGDKPSPTRADEVESAREQP
ncbi:MAG: hypothetical protein NZ740_05890 [Kiritimatiellae bacterium]|nr:hypothetical protein [Kiritimatiellia bacterium]MDW8458624.1 hypothetical protein [Verrucomicrobiota bacterium]